MDARTRKSRKNVGFPILPSAFHQRLIEPQSLIPVNYIWGVISLWFCGLLRVFCLRNCNINPKSTKSVTMFFSDLYSRDIVQNVLESGFQHNYSLILLLLIMAAERSFSRKQTCFRIELIQGYKEQNTWSSLRRN